MSLNIEVEQSTTLKVEIQTPPPIQVIIEQPESLKLEVQTPQPLSLIVQPPTEIRSNLLIGQGPAGPPGLGEIVPYSKRVDFVGSDMIYKGEALPGANDIDPVWRICKITFVSEDIVEQWAEGNANFDKMWSSRLNYNYY